MVICSERLLNQRIYSLEDYNVMKTTDRMDWRGRAGHQVKNIVDVVYVEDQENEKVHQKKFQESNIRVFQSLSTLLLYWLEIEFQISY